MWFLCLSSMTAIIYRKVRCSYLSLGRSLMPRGHVNNFLISALCRKLYDDCHPSVSKKHYFFCYIGVIILFIRALCILIYECQNMFCYGLCADFSTFCRKIFSNTIIKISLDSYKMLLKVQV
jgi:hypothetical protein